MLNVDSNSSLDVWYNVMFNAIITDYYCSISLSPPSSSSSPYFVLKIFISVIVVSSFH